ncbi:putative SAM-dependent methyltransferase [Acetoanaerobium pronyense]|uniref:SAM-dependent methyltransferase n=1 Tax=Acetoanaerobium pronyense TaxID=1482736 RepID=A0ABS4KM26_9FIRM|nr:DUF6762 family protein [Acetoanaerobium pronyense]MBP2028840.1 putative SAM-dependent methyltransferase [Acetoanaerobium pronyense]
MEPFAVIIMKKDAETGFLDKEVGSYMIKEHGDYIDSIYVLEQDGKNIAHMRVSTDFDVQDWQYSAIYDYYDEDKVKALEDVLSIEAIEEEFNPLWEIRFVLPEIEEAAEEMMVRILASHKNELDEVLKEIKDKEEEYL